MATWLTRLAHFDKTCGIKGLLFTVQKALRLISDEGMIILTSSTAASKGIEGFSRKSESSVQVQFTRGKVRIGIVYQEWWIRDRTSKQSVVRMYFKIRLLYFGTLRFQIQQYQRRLVYEKFKIHIYLPL